MMDMAMQDYFWMDVLRREAESRMNNIPEQEEIEHLYQPQSGLLQRIWAGIKRMFATESGDTGAKILVDDGMNGVGHLFKGDIR
jgi:hypothetical protein